MFSVLQYFSKGWSKDALRDDPYHQQKLEKDGFHKPTFAEDVARFRIEK